MLKFDFLIPTHNSLRDRKSIEPMVDFVKEGRIFRCADKPIAITQFQDGDMYIRDGHRRLCAMILAGARGILECEYVIEQMTYEKYLEFAPDNGWYTPFDPRTECRLPDFFEFKAKLQHDYEEGESFKTIQFEVTLHRELYKEPRTIHTLRDLVNVNFPNGCN